MPAITIIATTTIGTIGSANPLLLSNFFLNSDTPFPSFFTYNLEDMVFVFGHNLFFLEGV